MEDAKECARDVIDAPRARVLGVALVQDAFFVDEVLDPVEHGAENVWGEGEPDRTGVDDYGSPAASPKSAANRRPQASAEQ
jgi:hypothetical protein